MNPQTAPNPVSTDAPQQSSPQSVTLFSLGAILLLLGLLFSVLSQPSQNAVLVVSTHPAAAKVVLQQVELGDHLQKGFEKTLRSSTGLVRFSELPLGAKVRVVVSADGYKAQIATGTLPLAAQASQESPTLTLSVKLKPEGALLTVLTEPEGASLYIDNRHKGNSPALLSDLPPGLLEVEARLIGYQPVKSTVELTAGGNQKLVLKLLPITEVLEGRAPKSDEKIPAGQSQVQLVSSHACTFFIDNYIVGKHALTVVRNISAGEHLFGCRADKGFGTKSKRMKLKPDSVARAEFVFDEDPIDKAMRAQDKNDPLHWDIRGGGARGEGKVGTAVEYFKKSLELDPSYYPAHRQLSRTYPFLKDWDAAIFHAEAYLKGNPNAPDKKFTLEIIQTLKRKKLEEETGETYEAVMPVSRRRKK